MDSTGGAPSVGSHTEKAGDAARDGEEKSSPLDTGPSPARHRKRRRVDAVVLPPSHYETLGISEGASPRQIRSAYLRRSRELHPDKNMGGDAGTTEALMDVQEAFRVLRGRGSRDEYDQSRSESGGTDGSEGSQAGAGGGSAPASDAGSTSTAGSIHSSSAPSTHTTGSEGGKRVTAESVRSVFRSMLRDLDSLEASCSSFSVTAEKAMSCTEQAIYVTCSLSDLFCGVSKRVQYTATEWHVSGELRTHNLSLTVHIGAGWPHGTRVLFPSAGDFLVGSSRGDVAVVIHELPHPVFHRRGDDLVHAVSLDPATAAAGASIRLPMLDGTQLVAALPPISAPNIIAAARGFGMPVPTAPPGTRGCLVIAVSVAGIGDPSASSAALAAAASGASGMSVAPPVPAGVSSATVLDITGTVTVLAPPPEASQGGEGL